MFCAVARGPSSAQFNFTAKFSFALCLLGLVMAAHRSVEESLFSWGRSMFEHDLLVLAASSLRDAGINVMCSLFGRGSTPSGLPVCFQDLQAVRGASASRLARCTQCAGAKAVVKSFCRAMGKVGFLFVHAIYPTSILASRRPIAQSGNLPQGACHQIHAVRVAGPRHPRGRRRGTGRSGAPPPLRLRLCWSRLS